MQMHTMGAMPTALGDVVVTREALEILGLKDPSTISRWVQIGKLTPADKLPGRSGAFLFWRADVERLAADLRAAS